MLDSATLVVGGTTTVHMALRQVGVEPPLPLNIPEPLQEFAGRRIWQTRLGNLRVDILDESFSALFVKPAIDTKSFQGFVVHDKGDIDELDHLSANTELMVAEPVNLKSEWRYFVHKGEVVGIAHYSGDWRFHPEPDVVTSAVAAYDSAPIAYAIDFGVSDSGNTIPVEANDAFALGSHGIDAVNYALILEDHWLELTQNAIGNR